MTALTNLTSVLRLEVEDTPIGLVNLANNPDGELGGWAYVTPLTSSTMAGNPTTKQLTYSRTVAGASYFVTELIPITAGQYAAASFAQRSSGNAAHKVSLEWFNASKSLLSSTTPSPLIAASSSAKTTVGAALAPASTAYVRLRVDLYTSGGANPTGSHSFIFNNMTFCVAATAAALATIRTNLILNPSFETNATSWAPRVSAQNNVSAVTTVGGQSGSAALRSVSITASTFGILHQQIAVTGGKDYTFSGYVRAASTTRLVTPTISWISASGVVLGSDVGAQVSETSTGWTRISVTGQAPVGAATALLQVLWNASTVNEVHYFDAALFEQSSTLSTYFDGSIAASGSLSYAWNGSAHASSSKELNTQLDYLPIPFTNILGPTSEIKITRPPLDVGTLDGVVRSIALDPATSTLLQPGKRIRLQVLNSSTSLWEALYTGEVTDPRVDYDLTRTDDAQATISLTAIDRARDVANVTRSQGVATIPELPWILEGAGIPWNCDGSQNQVATATIVSNVENATALDQVALTRDTASGYAWISKDGVLNAFTSRSADFHGLGTVTLDESAYSSLSTSWSLDECINEVNVTYLRFNPTTLETTEVTFGPYVDEASRRQWGPRSKTFRVHGIPEANIPTFAAAVLAANKTPTKKVDQIKIPIRDTADLVKTKALLDQYVRVRILNTAKAIDLTQRVQTISHEISPPAAPGALARWIMTLDFATEASVAQPVPTPSPGNGPTADGVWIPIGSAGAPAFTNGWSNFGGAFATAAFMRKNGVTYLRGFVKSGTIGSAIFTLPAGYRPSEQRVFSAVGDRPTTSAQSAGTAHTHSIPAVGVRLDVLATGEVRVAAAAVGAYNNTFQSLDGIAFPAEQ